ncbi:MAG TPA: DUF2167 domain-containing protein [Candidatus Angelobacter sp.]
MARQAFKGVFAVLLLMFALTVVVAAQEPQSQSQNQGSRIQWQNGPTIGYLGDVAQLKIPAGYKFTGKAGALRVMELTHNPASGNELGVVIPAGDDVKWFMTFEFSDTGYVKDDEKDNLDADALLKSLQEGTEAANEERRKRGWKPFHITGWETRPYYDPLTHNLTWAIDGKGDDPTSSGSVNHSIRLLGRGGTMNVDLVVAPADYQASIAQFNAVIGGFSYIQGQRYSDFRAGDKVAKYGLAALIAGGTGAVLLKTGLLAKFWKLIVVGFAALVGLIKKIFSSLFGSKEIKIEDPNKQAAGGGQV